MVADVGLIIPDPPRQAGRAMRYLISDAVIERV